MAKNKYNHRCRKCKEEWVDTLDASIDASRCPHCKNVFCVEIDVENPIKIKPRDHYAGTYGGFDGGYDADEK